MGKDRVKGMCKRYKHDVALWSMHISYVLLSMWPTLSTGQEIKLISLLAISLTRSVKVHM